MPVDPIQFSRVINALHLQVQPNKTEKTNKKSDETKTKYTKALKIDQPDNIAVLRSNLKRRLEDASKKNKPEESKRSIFIEEIVAWEFGEDFLASPELKPVLEFISGVIDQDVKLKNGMSDIIDVLVK